LSSDNSKEFFNYITRVITRLGEDQRNLSYLTENVTFWWILSLTKLLKNGIIFDLK
jgi:hypothetical protein